MATKKATKKKATTKKARTRRSPLSDYGTASEKLARLRRFIRARGKSGLTPSSTVRELMAAGTFLHGTYTQKEVAQIVAESLRQAEPPKKKSAKKVARKPLEDYGTPAQKRQRLKAFVSKRYKAGRPPYEIQRELIDTHGSFARKYSESEVAQMVHDVAYPLFRQEWAKDNQAATKAQKKKRGPAIEKRRAPAQSPSADATARRLLATKSSKDISRLLGDERRRLLASRKEQVTSIRAQCKSAKEKTRARSKARREKILKMWAQNRADELERINRSCKARREIIDKTYTRGTARAKAIREAIRDEKRARAEHRKRTRTPEQVKASLRSAERRDEALEETRNEIEKLAPNLLPYFTKIKGTLRKKKNVSLSEQFFQRAQESPEAALLASERRADLEIAALLEQGEPRWKKQAQKIEAGICKRATRDAKKGRVFEFKTTERKALDKLGIDAVSLARECYNDAIPRRRIVSQRQEAAPF